MPDDEKKIYDEGELGPDQLNEAEESPSTNPSDPYANQTSPGKISYNRAKPQLKTGPLSSSTKPWKTNISGLSNTSGDNEEKSFWNASPLSSSTAKGKTRFGKFIGTRRGKTIFGVGGVVTITGIISLFTFMSGPLEFVHIAQLLEGFHLSTQQNVQDDRFLREIRFARLLRSGNIEKIRMGRIGNTVTSKFEAKLNDNGLRSNYTDIFGQFDGFVIDTSEGSPYHGMGPDDIKQAVKEKFGVEPVSGNTIKGSNLTSEDLVIDASHLSYLDTLKLNYGVLNELDASKLSAAIGARMFGLRAGISWHPLSSLKTNVKRSLEEWWNNYKDSERTGVSPTDIATNEDTAENKDPAAPKNAQDAESSAKTVLSESESPSADPAAEASSIHAKLTGSAAFLAGLLCIMKSLASQADEIKQTQVVMPLIRMSMDIIATGNQVMNGQDVDTNELGQLSAQLNGTDSSGKKSSWINSQSIQANLGNSTTGTTQPDGTLQSIGKGSPFDSILNNGAVSAVLGPVCSTAGQIISFLGGGIEGAVVSGILMAADTSLHITSQIANWLAGQAVNVAAVGGDYGNDIDFGAALAANSQAVTAGGSKLSATQAVQIQSATNLALKQEFNQNSIAYKLFNPYDANSAISKLIDNTSPSISQNMASMASGFINAARSIFSLPKLFANTAHADTAATYNYPFNTYGFSEQDLQNPLVANPYDNACHVIGCPDKGITGFLVDSSTNQPSAEGQNYIKKAQECFGVNIAPDTSGNWGVALSNDQGPSLYTSKYSSLNCDDNSDTNWLRLRFFIMDTETMNSMGCYEGDDEACSDIGFSPSSNE